MPDAGAPRDAASTAGMPVAAAVVLFQPPASCLDNIRTYLGDVGVLYAVDNSTAPDEALVAALADTPNVRYVAMGDNLGVGAALNAAARLAREDGYGRLLAMDQDSKAFRGMVPALTECADRAGEGIAVASASNPRDGDPMGYGWSETTVAITSGSLIDLAAWTELGGFDEALFVDQVDYEYCMRAIVAGYRVVKCHEALLVHQVGEPTVHRLLGIFPMAVSNHSPLRRYYMTRNTLYLASRYGKRFPEWARYEVRSRMKELLKIPFFESQRLVKLRMAWRGYRDHRRGRLGRYPDRLVDVGTASSRDSG